ncbi:N-acetylmuramoyl-L-alanine amidase-like domain-containing protein [Paraliomyxa miuraensis]|uniref:N-acetylmuramoyl-L-alanine amidase-like domain-containing protein n=1 Tax=Paraliomyxa miuraensis TaxID=376150 RepID=UPI00225BC796|nr:N-acetylmuramoyl-L-alanine amidase-like domain-containing protein [Paraliomyxa miuraensis]MCX4241610.1 DUF1460 domain-containing protein [Paraliomyxa miuraensis]
MPDSTRPLGRRWLAGLILAAGSCTAGRGGFEEIPRTTPAGSQSRSASPAAEVASVSSPAPAPASVPSPAPTNAELPRDPEPSSIASSGPAVSLSKRQHMHIEAWFQKLGEPRPDESFGGLLVRAAKLKLGTPYPKAKTSTRKGPEALSVDVDALDCVTLIETATAIARCSWQQRPDVPCFLEELRQTRYRDGHIDGYASRLHYFEDWMADNERRDRLRSLADELGADTTTRPFDYMTKHRRLYPPLREPENREAIRTVELRLSEMPQRVVPRERVAEIQHLLQDGDILGFIKGTPGLGVTHTGLVSLDDEGRPHVLHATDLNERVSLSRCDLATCMAKRSDRKGVIVMRPLPPPTAAQASHGDAITRAAPAAPRE